MIYKSIVGSRAYGLNTEDSDTDIAVVSGKQWITHKPKCHIFSWTPEDFAGLMQDSCHNWVVCSMLFPNRFCVENDLSKWISENREDMIKAMLPEIYQAYTAACGKFIREPYNKRIMYAIHFRDMLANYAEGMTFAEAIKPQGEDRDFLLSVRNGTASVGQVREANRKARERAKSAAGFYAEPRSSASVLREFRNMVYREAKKI